MDATKTFELKVGIFILIGIVILFIIAFSIGDIRFITKAGYHIKAIFNFASGIGGSAPVRLAGVGIGEVDGLRIFKDEKGNTKVEISAWIKNDVRIENDSNVTINTLGLLGEKYLEISPGTPGRAMLKNNDRLIGRDPVAMEKVTEDLAKLSDSITIIVERLKKGEGTVGKLLAEEDVYNDLKAITGNFRELSEDLKRHPWKLLSKSKGD